MNTALKCLTCALTLAAATATVSGPAHAQTPAQTAAPHAFILLDYQAVPPAGWEHRKSSSSARLLELVKRSAATKDSVEIVVYYFGRSQGGGVDANVERWTAQFNGPGRPEVKPKIEKLDGTMFMTTEVELEGSYARAVGMGEPSNAVPGQSLLASIVETPRGNLFVQMFGPINRVRAERDAYLTFVRGIRDR
jgi:hypothetical protein